MTDAAQAAPAAPAETSTPAQSQPVSQTPAAGVEGQAAPASAAKPDSVSTDKSLISDAPKDVSIDAAKADDKLQTSAEPPKYELKIPKESIADGDGKLISDFTELARKENIPPEVAQKVVDFAPKLGERIAQQNQQVWNETNANWQKEVKADPEIGGKNWQMTEKNLAYARDTYTKTPEENQALRQALLLTGAGNNPAIVKWISRMASQLAPPTTIPAKGSGGNKGSAASSLYPTMKQA